MRVFAAFISALAISAPAYAQQQTPMEQALAQKLTIEVNASLQCSAAQVTTQGQLQAAQARVKELQDKYEPKAEPTK
jgi:hypothetical protein